LAGNVVGAVLSVVSWLINSDQKDPDQMILDGIQQLQDEVNHLGEHLDARYDRVDVTLGAMFRSMNASFAQISVRAVGGAGPRGR
jgi:hypothetical protein